MNFRIVGTIEEIFEEKQVTENFKKREFILSVIDGVYTDLLKFEVGQDRCDRLNFVKVGDEVEVKFSIGGRKYTNSNTGKVNYFVTLKAFYISSGQNSQPQSQYGGDDLPPQGEPTHAPSQANQAQPQEPVKQSDYMADDGVDDDIPF